MKKSKRRRITLATLAQVALRSFFLQACWNFQRMQNLGFAFAILPVLRCVQGTRAGLARAVRRHLEFFVTQPYCASLIFGVVARLEEAAKDPEGDAADISRIKSGMMGPLAALGDTFFWATLKPGLALVGASLVLLTPVGRVWPALAGPLVFLGLYSVAHLSLRFGGVVAGYRRGVDIIKNLRQVNLQGWSRRLSLFTAIVAGAAAASVFAVHPWTWLQPRVVDSAALSGVGGLLFFGLRRGLSPSRLFYLLVALGVLAGYAGVG